MSSWILIRSVSARICSLLIRCGECTNLSRSSRTDVYYTPSLPKKIREWPRTSPERAIIKWAQEYLEISSFAHELLIFSYRLWLDGAPSYFFWQTTVTLNIDRKKSEGFHNFPSRIRSEQIWKAVRQNQYFGKSLPNTFPLVYTKLIRVF